MKRWLPTPLMSLALLLLWLMLNQSIEPAHLLLGAIIAIAVPLLIAPLRPTPARVSRPLTIIRLTIYALIEILRSCFNVCTLILFGRGRLNSQFIRIPLDLRDPHGLAVLACIINSTPGTVWVEIIPGSNDLALHVFDLHDAAWWVNMIKTRLESPLIEIFEQEKA
ncbi:Na+/H+ antiporter subunit E [Halopseudomonas xiamenensis]|uniref:Na+/H+ antiporter subunit E n=1 Tax=Halopseudomonas xiamenensis TaxID=157792 RepID=UPI001623BECC|nr:Na+/H+ antiporter subunit E [Halopseudomonas xiamenensis]